MPYLVATLIYLSQISSYYIRGNMSPLSSTHLCYRNTQCFYGNASQHNFSYVCHTMYIVI